MRIYHQIENESGNQIDVFYKGKVSEFQKIMFRELIGNNFNDLNIGDTKQFTGHTYLIRKK